MSDGKQLPAGQIARNDFPRFGLWDYANFSQVATDEYSLLLAGDIEPIDLNQSALSQLERVEQVSDFHCVTTWSYCNVCWSGYRFRDIYERIVAPQIPSDMNISLVVFRGQDQYKSSLLLSDALTDDVLLVDKLNGANLDFDHGAPLRLIAPAHYGYKNVKHLRKIEFWQDQSSYRQSFMSRIVEHPRARVAHEERSRYLPGWIYRYLYRPLIDMTVRRMKTSELISVAESKRASNK